MIRESFLRLFCASPSQELATSLERVAVVLVSGKDLHSPSTLVGDINPVVKSVRSRLTSWSFCPQPCRDRKFEPGAYGASTEGLSKFDLSKLKVTSDPKLCLSVCYTKV